MWVVDKKGLSLLRSQLANQSHSDEESQRKQLKMGKVGEDLQTVKEVLNRISISKEEKQKNVAEAVEKTVKEKLIPLMKEESALFKALFNRVVHSGSFYDNVKYDCYYYGFISCYFVLIGPHF